ncbi:MAG: pseudaminic acid synthase [Proteobacteria bacterium]|nr:pseudaminic acid synthase [Pseudomonadota bacterium]
MELYMGGIPVGPGNRPYIIAEMSGNHNQSYEQAIEIATAAKRAGANALKLQTYTPDTLTIDSENKDFFISEEDSLWTGETLYSLYEKAYTDWDWVRNIHEYCKKIELECFSSVFDETSIEFWEKLSPCAYKIASFENIHYPLIRQAAETGRPLIISTGLASEDEIDEAVSVARDGGCKDLVLLKCTSDYPASVDDANLASIPCLAQKYQCIVGLSDHTRGNHVALASVALGASIIEKHFTKSRSHEGVDSAFSADETELSKLVEEVVYFKKAVGSESFGVSINEEKSLRYRRSIYAVADITQGEIFSSENIRIIRPGFGLHPRYWQSIIGKTSEHSYTKGDRIKLSEVEPSLS